MDISKLFFPRKDLLLRIFFYDIHKWTNNSGNCLFIPNLFIQYLLYNLLYLLYSQFVMLICGEMWFFSVAIEKKQLKFLVKICVTQPHLECTLFWLSVCWSCFKRHKPHFLKVSWFSLSFCILLSLYFLHICFINHFVRLSITYFLCFATFGCCHPC